MPLIEPTRTQALADAKTRTESMANIIASYAGFGNIYSATVRLKEGVAEQTIVDHIAKTKGVEEVKIEAIKQTGAHRIGLVLNRQLKA